MYTLPELQPTNISLVYPSDFSLFLKVIDLVLVENQKLLYAISECLHGQAGLLPRHKLLELSQMHKQSACF